MRGYGSLRTELLTAVAAAMLAALVSGCGDDSCTVQASFVPPEAIEVPVGECRGERCNVVFSQEVPSFPVCQAIAAELNCSTVNVIYRPKTGGCQMEDCGVCLSAVATPTVTPAP